MDDVIRVIIDYVTRVIMCGMQYPCTDVHVCIHKHVCIHLCSKTSMYVSICVGLSTIGVCRGWTEAGWKDKEREGTRTTSRQSVSCGSIMREGGVVLTWRLREGGVVLSW